MFYDRFVELCKAHNITPSRAAIEAGLSKSTVTKWKKEPDSKPSGNVLNKLCTYFHMSVSELLGEGSSRGEADGVTDEDIKFALFGGAGVITDEMYEEVKNFAAFVKQREAAKKKKE